MFVETVLKLSFGFTDVLLKAVVALYHVNDVFSVTVEVMSEGSGFTCMRFVRQVRPRALGTKKIS